MESWDSCGSKLYTFYFSETQNSSQESSLKLGSLITQGNFMHFTKDFLCLKNCLKRRSLILVHKACFII